MRHRAPRPLADGWHRLARAAAHRLGQAAGYRAPKMLMALTVALSLGIGGYLGLASVMGGSTSRQAGSAAPTASHDAEPGQPTSQVPAPEGPGPDGRASEPDDSTPGPTAPGQSQPPSPTSEETLARRMRLGRLSASSSTRSVTPSPSPDQPSLTPSLEDLIPPNTILSEEFPEPDAAQFGFSALGATSFTCSLDGAPYTSCDSPTRYSGLEPGWHTFAVRAVDAAGNVDPSPAEARWLATDGHAEDQ